MIIVLTPKELKTLSALASGLLYKEIADKHFISINTVKKHLKNAYRKIAKASNLSTVDKKFVIKYYNTNLICF